MKHKVNCSIRFFGFGHKEECIGIAEIRMVCSSTSVCRLESSKSAFAYSNKVNTTHAAVTAFVRAKTACIRQTEIDGRDDGRNQRKVQGNAGLYLAARRSSTRLMIDF